MDSVSSNQELSVDEIKEVEEILERLPQIIDELEKMLNNNGVK
ncbi:MAG: hypothetical protein ABFC84_06415 [Veillonellales bacterium]